MDQAPQRVDLREVNRRFYDALWRDTRLIEPHRFNTWPLVSSLTAPGQRRLEVAPGLRPRLPLDGTQFLDASAPAVAKLSARGAHAVCGSVTALPFASSAFDLVCAFDIVEHLDEDEPVWSELARVSAAGAILLLSLPLHPECWTAFDDFVGHRRRYEPARVSAKLSAHGFTVEQSAVYGMQPKSSRLLGAGMWFLVNQRERALWWYNNIFMPLGVHFQQKLALVPGLIDTRGVDEVLLVCRKRPGAVQPARRSGVTLFRSCTPGGSAQTAGEPDTGA
jgi:SAM-dependent methyltransferase